MCIRDRLSAYLSFAAATPGNSFPSKNSREAPPPVEICVILSPYPKIFTAAAESPPPMIVVASVSASAFATAAVPCAKFEMCIRDSIRIHSKRTNNGNPLLLTS